MIKMSESKKKQKTKKEIAQSIHKCPNCFKKENNVVFLQKELNYLKCPNCFNEYYLDVKLVKFPRI